MWAREVHIRVFGENLDATLKNLGHTHDINNLKLTFDDDVDLVNCSLYKNMRGSLMYLVNIKVDIFYVVNTPSQYMVAPWETHWVVVKHVFIYLRGIVHYGIR